MPEIDDTENLTRYPNSGGSCVRSVLSPTTSTSLLGGVISLCVVTVPRPAPIDSANPVKYRRSIHGIGLQKESYGRLEMLEEKSRIHMRVR
jgi:hypothetical protein